MKMNYRDTTMAANFGLTVGFTDDTGILSISGSTTARNYETFLRTVNYVNTVNDRTLEHHLQEMIDNLF